MWHARVLPLIIGVLKKLPGGTDIFMETPENQRPEQANTDMSHVGFENPFGDQFVFRHVCHLSVNSRTHHKARMRELEHGPSSLELIGDLFIANGHL